MGCPAQGPWWEGSRGSCMGTCGEATVQRASQPRHVGRKQLSGNPGCTLSSWFYITSRH